MLGGETCLYVHFSSFFYCYVPFLITEPELGQQEQRFQHLSSCGFLLIYISSPFYQLKFSTHNLFI